MAQLQFTVTNQWIERTDTFKPVAYSKNYLYAEFRFITDEWNEGNSKTAIFRNSEEAYEQILDENNECSVPWEILETDGGLVYVSVFSGDLVTANKVPVRVYGSGYSDDVESSEPPTPSVYEQILSRIQEIENTHNDIDGGLFTDWS